MLVRPAIVAKPVDRAELLRAVKDACAARADRQIKTRTRHCAAVA